MTTDSAEKKDPGVDPKVERLAALGEVSAMIAHEIRNPLGSIRLNLNYLCMQNRIPHAYQKQLKNIELGVGRIQSITEGILNYIRPIEIDLRCENIHKVIDSSLHEVRYACLRSGIEIKKKYGAARSHLILDINQMMQVFVNLLLNAIDAMSTGGVITINTLSDETEVEVRIEDEGKGIAKEHLQRIFDPFFSTRTQGIGLGLAIASRILLQHKGRISVQSKVGVGTKFMIRLPLELSGDRVNG